MFKYKASLVLGLILGIFILFLPAFYLETANFSLLQFFYALPEVMQANTSMWLISIVIAYLLFYIITIGCIPFLKENHLKVKCFFLILLDLLGYLLIVMLAAPSFSHLNYHISFGSFIIIAWQSALVFLSLLMPNKMVMDKTKETAQTDTQAEKTDTVPCTDHQTEKEQEESALQNKDLLPVKQADQKPENHSFSKADNMITSPYSSAAKEMLSFDDLKQLSKVLVLIHIAMLISFFMTWNSDVSKTTGIILFLSGNGLLDIFSKGIVLLLIHLLLSNLLFFKNRTYFLAASFINDLIVIIAWLRALDLIGFVNMALAPLLCLGLAVLSIVMILFSVRKNNQTNAYQISLYKDILAYLKELFSTLKKGVQSLILMVREWKD